MTWYVKVVGKCSLLFQHHLLSSLSQPSKLFLQLEEVQSPCDPNPAEYVDVDVEEPNAVFYWGLLPGKTNFPDIESVKEAFWKVVSNGYQWSPGRLELSIVQVSQLLNHARLDNARRKSTKACWKIFYYNQQRIPIYSQHLPYYVVGYMTANRDTEYPSAGG